MRRLALAFSLLALVAPGLVARAAPILPAVVVHLTISGGWTYSGTLRSKPGSPGSSCMVTTYVVAAGAGRRVFSTFTVDLQKSDPHTIHKQFALTLLNYRPGVRRYSKPLDALIDVTVRKHSYYGSRSTDPRYRIAVQFGQVARTGTFWATNVGTTDLTGKWPSVTLQGTWTCIGITNRTIQVMGQRDE